MGSKMVLMVVCWQYGMPFDANGNVSTPVNVYWTKWIYFFVNEFEVSVNDSVFSGNEQQKVYYTTLPFPFIFIGYCSIITNLSMKKYVI